MYLVNIDFGFRGLSFKSSYLHEIIPVFKQKLLFIKETDDTFGHIVVWSIYTSHIDHFTPQHTPFEQLAACLSVFLELLPGLIPFAILWQAGWSLEKTICMNMDVTEKSSQGCHHYGLLGSVHGLNTTNPT